VNGCFNEMTTLNGMAGIETTEFLLSKIDDFGTPKAYNHYAVGWAHALCAPYQWDQAGGLARGGHPATAPSCTGPRPEGKGELRKPVPSHHRHPPTIPGGGRTARAASVNGIAQAPLEGVSMLGTLRDGTAPETHDVQYFEMFGNRGIYHQGWTACDQTPHSRGRPTSPPLRRGCLGAVRARRLDAGA